MKTIGHAWVAGSLALALCACATAVPQRARALDDAAMAEMAPLVQYMKAADGCQGRALGLTRLRELPLALPADWQAVYRLDSCAQQPSAVVECTLKSYDIGCRLLHVGH